MQEIQSGIIMILQQPKEPNLKLPQLFYGLQQLIDEPTHIRKNSCSCIGLIFTHQSNLNVNSRTSSSLYDNCQHQINGINEPISQFNCQGSFTKFLISEQINLFKQMPSL